MEEIKANNLISGCVGAWCMTVKSLPSVLVLTYDLDNVFSFFLYNNIIASSLIDE